MKLCIKINPNIPKMKKFIFLVIALSLSISSFAQLTLFYTKNGKYGFVNSIGDTVIPPIYDYAEPFSEGLALVKTLKGYKLVDTLGRLWDISKLNQIHGLRYDWGIYHSGMPLVVPQWKCQFIDMTGRVVIDLPYQDAESFHNNKAKVIQGDKYSYINHYGMVIESWHPIPDDYRAVKFHGFIGYVNRNGKLKIGYQYRKGYDFHNGIAKVSADGQNWAIINKKGKYISAFYDNISDFSNGIAVVRKGRYYGFINKKGKFLSGWYEKVEKMDSALYRVKKDDKFALVVNGYQVTKWYDDIERYNDKYWIAQQGDKYAFLNNMGAYVVGWYNKLWINPDYPDLVFVYSNGKYGFYNIHNYYISPMYDTLVFSEGIAMVRKMGKYGFINMYGKKITDLIFDHATPFHNAIATVEKDGKVAYINHEGKLLIHWIPKNIIVKSPPPGLILVKVGSKYGFQTLNGRRVIPAIYDYAEPFSDGVALVKLNPRKMLIDTLGQLKPLSAYPKDKSIRLDWGYRHTGKPIIVTVWTVEYINPKGQVVLKIPYQDATSFHNGKAKVFQGDKYNFIDKQGHLLGQWKELPDDYHVAEHGGKFGFINKNDKLVIPYKFDYAYDFHNGIAKVEIGNKFTLINRKGQQITGLFDDISEFKNNLALVKNNGKYAVIDTSGKVISKWYDKIWPFHDGIARVMLNGKYSFINSKGKQICGFFDNANDFSSNMAAVEINGKWGYINTDGKLVIKPKYDWASDFIGGIAKVSLNNKFAFINPQGKRITDWYDRIFFFSDDMAPVAKNGKWGYININGKLVIPLIYDRAFAFENGKALVIQHGKMFYIDKQGYPLGNENSNY